MKCPKCGKAMEEHGINPGEFHWWFCWRCSEIVDDTEECKTEGEPQENDLHDRLIVVATRRKEKQGKRGGRND